MSVADTILQQLGGHKFVVMTGSSHFVSDKNTLRMKLAKNKSKANKLDIMGHLLQRNLKHFLHHLNTKNTKITKNSHMKSFMEILLLNHQKI